MIKLTEILDYKLKDKIRKYGELYDTDNQELIYLLKDIPVIFYTVSLVSKNKQNEPIIKWSYIIDDNVFLQEEPERTNTKKQAIDKAIKKIKNKNKRR